MKADVKQFLPHLIWSESESHFLAYFDCIMDFFGIVVGWGSHQTDNEALKFSRELIFEIINQVLMKENFSDAGLKTAILSF